MKLSWKVGLPFGHLAVDCLILVLFLWHVPFLDRAKPNSFALRIQPVLFFQEGPSITFDPFIDSRPESFLLGAGTLPALLISGRVRSKDDILRPAKFVTYEIVSFPVWFTIGALLDNGIFRIRKSMITYLAARLSLAIFGIAEIGWRIEMLCWLAFAMYAIFVGGRWVVSKTLHLPRTIPGG